MFLILPGVELGLDDFIKSRAGAAHVTELDAIQAQLVTRLRKRLVEKYDQKRAYLRRLYGALRGKNDSVSEREAMAAARAFSRFMAYKPISSINQFVADEVLDRKDLGEAVRSVSSRLKTIHGMEREAQELNAEGDSHLRMVLVDEAFSKMDESRSREVIDYLTGSLGLQLIFIMPTSKCGPFCGPVDSAPPHGPSTGGTGLHGGNRYGIGCSLIVRNGWMRSPKSGRFCTPCWTGSIASAVSTASGRSFCRRKSGYRPCDGPMPVPITHGVCCRNWRVAVSLRSAKRREASTTSIGRRQSSCLSPRRKRPCGFG